MYQHQDQTQHQYYQQYNSYNPSIEDLIASSDDKRYQNGGIGNLLQRPPVAGLPYISSQVNPNTSSANLSKLTNNINNYGYNNNNNSYIQLHTPPLSSNPSFTSFQNLNYPLSPLSKPTSPEPILSAASVTTSNFLASSFFSWLPPIDVKIVSFCIGWYLCSIISSNSTKLILNDFKFPVTLTQFQFSASFTFCLVFLNIVKVNPESISSKLPPGFIPSMTDTNRISLSEFITPTRLIIQTTLPMGMFQFIGHITSHKATSLIPVSIVHTIKSLSPIITVLIYRFLFGKSYRMRTYVTLIPLCCGIMLTCYKKSHTSDQNNVPGAGSSVINNNLDKINTNNNYSTGLIFAFISMIIFVSQNIFAKKRLTVESTNAIPMNNKSSLIINSNKVDKLTILFYCSIIGFILTCPIYFVTEWMNYNAFGAISLLQLNSYVMSLVLLNGLSHFVQSLLAFQILGMVSPINYSIANILKRIFIILISFIWELKQFSNSQSIGLVITLFGLYCYDRWGTVSNSGSASNPGKY
ncbi:hypothetical protein GWM34_02545, partial [Candida africana]